MKKHLIRKNIFVIALFLSAFLKNVDGMEYNTTTVYQMCFDNLCENILNYSPEKLLELANGKKICPQYIANDIPKVLITSKPLFFPVVDSYPRIIKRSRADFSVRKIISPGGTYLLATTSTGRIAKLVFSSNNQSIATFQHDDLWVADFSPNGTHVFTTSNNLTAIWEVHPLWNSSKYRNGQLSLQELAVVLLILKHKDFVNSNPEIRAVVEKVLSQIDDPVDEAEIVPDEQRHIKNFFIGLLKSQK